MALKYNAEKLQLLIPSAKRHTQVRFTQDNISVRPSNLDDIVKAIYEDLEVISASLGITQSFVSLTDTPADYTGVENRLTGVKTSGDGVEFKNWLISASNLYPGSDGGTIGKSGNGVGKVYFATSGNLDYEGDLELLSSGIQIGVFKGTTGYLGIGVANPLEPIHLSGAIVLGEAIQSTAGTIQWSGLDFEGYDGSNWVSLTSGTNMSSDNLSWATGSKSHNLNSNTNTLTNGVWTHAANVITNLNGNVFIPNAPNDNATTNLLTINGSGQVVYRTTSSLVGDFFNKVSDTSDDIVQGSTNLFNATHSGDVSGATALTAQPALITGKSSATASATDLLLISDVDDSNNLKQITVQSILNLTSSDNIGNSNLIITDLLRELQVAENGTFQIVTNDANNSASFKVGENSNERFDNIELNSQTFDQTTSIFDTENNGVGVITRINPNEYEVVSRSDISDANTKRNRLYFSPDETVIESVHGKIRIGTDLGSGNFFEDLRATKKGLEYFADYSANFSVRSLVDKGYVDNAVSGVPTLYANNGTVGSTRVVTLTDTLSFSGGRVSFDTTTNGILLPRLTTVQMNAIASPATNLLVYNTDLNGLYRYNGSAWVALSAGYGIIEVRDASGYPTFYADLQTAINVTADIDTVYIHSDIQITSQISLPQRSSLTFQMNGRRIWSDTSGGDFNIFRVTNNNGNPQRHLRFEGGGIFEQTGTIVSGVNSAILYAVNIGTTPLEIYAGTTIFRAENALVMNSNGFDFLDGGYLIATNSAVSITADVNNSYWDCYESCQLPTSKKIKNTVLKTRYGGYFAPSGSGGEIENCHIEGDVTKSGNYGLMYVNGSKNVRNCFLRQTHATGRDALFVGGSGSGGDISNNVCINMGTGYGGNFVHGASSNNYFYSANGIALYSGTSSTRFNDNVCINNSSTLSALYCQGTIITNNTAINLNASNPQPAMYVGRNTGTCEIYGNRAEVANASAYNWRFLFAGATTYYAYNIMGRVGLGLNPIGAPVNAMVNTPDAYGNLKIG